MNCETGEVEASIECDKETGEAPSQPHLNAETGELEMNMQQPCFRRSFRVPTKYIRNTPKRPQKDRGDDSRDIRTSSIVLFLLPTIYFVPIVALILGGVEVLLHIWTHKKNKSLISKEIYYQSPLHIISSQFCTSCVDELSKDKITRLQDKWNNKLIKNSAECLRIVT